MKNKHLEVTTLMVYLDDGRVFGHQVEIDKVREHASAIVSSGYHHCDGDVFEWYPPHRILKVRGV